MRDARRKLLKTLAVAGLLAGDGIPGLIRSALANGNKPIQAGLRKLSGKVMVNGLAAHEGMIIATGDTVATGPGAQAIYVIGQDAFLQRADTQVIFEEDAVAFFRLVTGKLLSVFGRGEKRLIVPTATIGIRGTACYLEAGENRTYFCLCYGEAEIVPVVAPQEREVIRTMHHDHPLYIDAVPKMSTAMVPAEVINHTDAELIMLEELVGRLPPFYGKTDRSY